MARDIARDLPSSNGFALIVIPGSPDGRGPESMNTGLWKMDSGFAAWRRPGMTSTLAERRLSSRLRSGYFRGNHPAQSQAVPIAVLRIIRHPGSGSSHPRGAVL